MEYNIKELSNMTDMEYDIFTRSIDGSQNEDDWKTIVDFWEEYIRDMEDCPSTFMIKHF